MAHKEQKDFCLRVKQKFPEFFKNKRVLDIGSLDINGSNRDLFENCKYIGLDVDSGKNVDVVSVGHLYDAPDESFDVIISTEVFEHDMFYEKTIQNISRMLKKGGLFIFTCASTSRPEHGTRKCGQDCAPLLINISEKWADYYKNLEENDIRKIRGFEAAFPDGNFELGNYQNGIPADLYFYGVKGGVNLEIGKIPEPQFDFFNDDIFVIDSWTDTLEKKKSLIALIKLLKIYNIPILLVSHYPVEQEIQSIVDYYIFDKENPLLFDNEFDEYNVHSSYWVNFGDFKLEAKQKFHHDYAIWKTLKTAFNFCKFLGKNNIHFLEYDNLPDPVQYRQCFLERIRDFDAIIYEDIKTDIEYCATFIFSIKTEVAINLINLIKSKREYFYNKPNGWQLERVFLKCLKSVTNNINSTKYIDNDKTLNTQAVWNRDGIFREGCKIQIYPSVDAQGDLYVTLISGFSASETSDDYLIEINYDKHKNFHLVKKGEYHFINVGEYIKGKTLTLYFCGNCIFEKLLDESAEEFFIHNSMLRKGQMTHTNQIFIDFIDGPKVEILGNQRLKYDIKFIDNDSNKIIYQTQMMNNCWSKCIYKYFVNWRLEVSCHGFSSSYDLNLSGKNVFINMESSSLGDSLAWIEAANQFKIKHNCNLICKTFHNYLFRDAYPDIKFNDPGEPLGEIHAQYNLGIFYNGDSICYNRHRSNPLAMSLSKIADDILGVNSDGIVPKIKKPQRKNHDTKYICIATQSTAQCKYWNNKNGWDSVVQYLKELGYDVICIDRHDSFGAGNSMNYIPNGCINKTGDFSLDDRIEDLVNCDFFIGLSSGLSWLAWACGAPVVLISGFTDHYNEFYTPYRVINKNVCNSCWNDPSLKFDPSDWMWCPRNKNFECSKEISFEMVKDKINECLRDL